MRWPRWKRHIESKYKPLFPSILLEKRPLRYIGSANYQMGIWKAADIPRPRLPQPTDGHDWTTTDGKLQPKWFQRQLFPANVEDDRLQLMTTSPH